MDSVAPPANAKDFDLVQQLAPDEVINYIPANLAQTRRPTMLGTTA
jgi:hypothetical protein